MKLKNIKLFFTDSKARFRILTNRGLYRNLDDEKYLKKSFKVLMGKELDLAHPKTYNEKIQWLKLYDRNPRYTTLVDKYEVKKVVAEMIGEEYVIPTLGVWNSFDEIDFEKLPKQFVLKCTHDSGGLVICKDKDTLNIKAVKKKINKSLSRNYYYSGREWPYKNVKPRIIAEQYMENTNGTAINDYKIQCFNGEPDNILVCVDRYSDTGVKYHYFSKEWKYLPYCPYDEISEDQINIERPEKLSEMLEIAKKLSEGIPQLRVDLYEIGGKVYFGELTFFSSSGFDTDITKEADLLMGKKLILKSEQ